MKLSFIVPIQKRINKDKINCFKRISFLASIGYDGVELAVADPGSLDLCSVERVLTKFKLEVSAVGTGLAFKEEKLSLSSPSKDIRRSAINRVKKHIEFAKEFNAQVIIGLIRGKVDGLSEDTPLWKRFYGNLLESTKRLCEYAAKKNTLLTLEPINRYETSFLNNIDQTLEFMARVRCANLKILLDTFHMNIEESAFLKPIMKVKKYISHVHFADSNRCYPGKGHIDFNEIVKALANIGYNDYVSGEIMLKPDFNKSALGFITNVRKYLNK